MTFRPYPEITINEIKLTNGQAMRVRLALLTSSYMDKSDDADSNRGIDAIEAAIEREWE